MTPHADEIPLLALAIAKEQVLWWRTCDKPFSASQAMEAIGRSVRFATWGEVLFAAAFAWLCLDRKGGVAK